jgi:glutamate-1-semialdehyde 2,1-aminomutase
VYGDLHRNVHPRPGVLGADANVDQRTRVVPFNDLNALEAALSDHQVACVLAEPVMTNCGMIEPLPGFWDTARALTHHTQTLLLLDETHTLASGLGGYAARFSWQADMIVMGKSIAGGIPAAVWGFSEAIAVQFEQLLKTKPAGHSGIGTTLSGNAVGIAAMQAVLETCMTDAAYTHMLTLAKMLEHELMQLIHRKSLHMSVSRCGARLELIFTQQAPRNALEMNAVQDEMLERALHIGLMNRGQILTPFHNMMLICPYTQEAQVRALVSAFDEVFTELLAA